MFFGSIESANAQLLPTSDLTDVMSSSQVQQNQHGSSSSTHQ